MDQNFEYYQRHIIRHLNESKQCIDEIWLDKLSDEFNERIIAINQEITKLVNDIRSL